MEKKDKLKVEYSTLSMLQDFFPKTSIHKAAVYIDKRMAEIIQELEKGDTGEVVPMHVFHPYPDVLHTEEGYPTDAALNYLQNWWFGYKNGELYKGEFAEVTKENTNALINYLRKLWHFVDWGFVHNQSDKKLELHTGGWSGNEEIIPYLEMTWFHKCYWSMSRKGGHYYYEWK
jgi:hypothetical protein